MRYAQYSTVKANFNNILRHFVESNTDFDASTAEHIKAKLQNSLEKLQPDASGGVNIEKIAYETEFIADLLQDKYFGITLVENGQYDDELPLLRIFNYLTQDLTTHETCKIHGRIVLHILERYFSLITEVAEISITYSKHSAKISFNLPANTYISRHQIEAMMLGCHQILRRYGDNKTEEIAFAHPAPSENMAPYLKAFGLTPIFEALNYFINIKFTSDISKVDKEIIHLYAQLESQKKLLSNNYSYSERLKELLKNSLYLGILTREQFSAIFNVSVRTLQRKLKEENACFSSILETARKEQTLELLKDTQLPVNHVAFLLGYQDPSAFYKAFKKWFKKTPLQFRADNPNA